MVMIWCVVGVDFVGWPAKFFSSIQSTVLPIILSEIVDVPVQFLIFLFVFVIQTEQKREKIGFIHFFQKKFFHTFSFTSFPTNLFASSNKLWVKF